MKLRGDRLKQIAEERGVSREQLAAAVERVGIKGPNALKAINNWFEGNDHPRCKAQDIAKLAQAVGAQTKDIARFTSYVMYHRGSPRKADLLVDLIRGKNVLEAENMLTFTTKRAALNVKKALQAAISDAQQYNADEDALFVVESRIDDAPQIKRFQPKDRGRAHPIIKRQSHITVAVEERVKGAKRARGGKAAGKGK